MCVCEGGGSGGGGTGGGGLTTRLRAQELCESRGGRPGFPVPNKLQGFCGRKATLHQSKPTDFLR